MTDRDYFAAAALTRGMGVLGYEQIAKSCYEMADAMLRNRERTNHDAVPEARAAEPESSVPLGSVAAPANTLTLTDEEREAVLHFSGHYAGFYGRAMHRLAMRLGLYDLPRDTPDAQATPGEGSVQDRCTLTDEEREAVERAIETLDGWQKTGGYHSAIEDDAATLRKLLERTKAV